MGYVPDLHKIWVGTSDQQLMALSNEFPGFYRYAPIMEEASEAERNKASRPYDGMAGFSEEHKQRAAQLLVTVVAILWGQKASVFAFTLAVLLRIVEEANPPLRWRLRSGPAHYGRRGCQREIRLDQASLPFPRFVRVVGGEVFGRGHRRLFPRRRLSPDNGRLLRERQTQPVAGGIGDV
jgi:hypothetical protein